MKKPANSSEDARFPSPAQGGLADLPTLKTQSILRPDAPVPSAEKTHFKLPSETRKHHLMHVADVPTTKTRLDLDLWRAISGKYPAVDSLPEPQARKTFWQSWYPALLKVLPVYIAIHVALLALGCLAFLFTQKDFSTAVMPISTLWEEWNHWDTAHYLNIALHGYYSLVSMAFFPLYPLLERAGMFATGDPFTAGLIVSNVAELVMFVVLYRLVERDFGGNRAFYALFYLAIFPTAFFFSAAYSESVFLCLSTLTFYQIRQGRWWLAGLCGFLATCTRPDGLYLTIPFCYEYLCRVWERQGKAPFELFSLKSFWRLLKGLRGGVLLALCMPMGIVLFMGVGYYRFHDFLAFVHSHKAWNRYFHIPGWGILKALKVMFTHGFLSFFTLRTGLDLVADIFIGLLLFCSFIGPWKLPRRLWAYNIYATVLFIYFQAFPRAGDTPLESMSRFLLELFPAFIILAGMSEHRTVHLTYSLLASVLFFFLATQFMMGRWVL